MVTIKSVEGGVYCIAPLQKGKLVAAVNSTVIIFNFKNNTELQAETRFYNNVLVMTLDVVGKYIYVGDYMRSLCLLEYNNEDGTVKELARDYNPRQAAAIKAVGYFSERDSRGNEEDEEGGAEPSSSEAINPPSQSQTQLHLQSQAQTPLEASSTVLDSTASVARNDQNTSREDNANESFAHSNSSTPLPQICMLADENNDLLLLQRRFFDGEIERQIQLQTTACIHLGSYVTGIVSGSLVMTDVMENSEFLYRYSDNNWLLTCNDGSVLSLLRINDDIYRVLLEVQEHVRNSLSLVNYTDFTSTKFSELDGFGLELTPIGGIKHENWRACAQHVKVPDYDPSSGKSTSSIGKSKERGIVDGDLLEYLLTFSREKIKQLFHHSEITYRNRILSGEDIVKLIDDFSRLH